MGAPSSLRWGSSKADTLRRGGVWMRDGWRRADNFVQYVTLSTYIYMAVTKIEFSFNHDRDYLHLFNQQQQTTPREVHQVGNLFWL